MRITVATQRVYSKEKDRDAKHFIEFVVKNWLNAYIEKNFNNPSLSIIITIL